MFFLQVMEMSLSTVGWGSLVLISGLTSRTIGAYLAVSGGENNYKEKIFVSLAWLPEELLLRPNVDAHRADEQQGAEGDDGTRRPEVPG